MPSKSIYKPFSAKTSQRKQSQTNVKSRCAEKLSIRHQQSLQHPLVKGNPLKAAILETVEDFALMAFIADLFKPYKH